MIPTLSLQTPGMKARQDPQRQHERGSQRLLGRQVQFHPRYRDACFGRGLSTGLTGAHTFRAESLGVYSILEQSDELQ